MQFYFYFIITQSQENLSIYECTRELNIKIIKFNTIIFILILFQRHFILFLMF